MPAIPGTAALGAGSAPARARRRAGRWLLAWLTWLAWAAPACTLSDDSFEPLRVDGAELQEGAVTSGPAESSAGASGADPRERVPGPAPGTDAEGPPNVGAPPAQSPTSGNAGAGGGSAGGAAGQAGAAAAIDPDGPDAGAPPPIERCTSRAVAGRCYELFDAFVTWDVAEQSCVAWGGHLASVESSEEDAALGDWPAELGITAADGSGIWLGGTDAQLDGTFVWIDGSPVTVPGWAPDQPNDGAGVDCIEKRNDGVGLWYDRRCIDLLRYVCERPL